MSLENIKHVRNNGSLESNPANKVQCTQCQNYTLVLDVLSSEYVCSTCGCVSNEKIYNNDLPYFEKGEYKDKSRTGMPESLTVSHKGLSTLIGLNDTDGRGKMLDPVQKETIQRLRTWNNRSQLNDSISRNLDKALKYLNNFGDKLYLSPAVMENAAYIYRKAAMRKLAKGRSTVSLVAASIYAACREISIPKTISDIANVCNIPSKEIMSHYKLILKELSLKIPVIQGIDYVTLISNRLKLTEKTKREAIRIFSLVQHSRISIGKNPRAFAGAIIYIASQDCNEFLRQVEVCQVADISTVSLRKRCKEIKTILDSQQ
ncbi:MAG: transcription initiation factor IIB [Nitrososphaeraceae archaeon]|jgi:transcription initiation factor TFIIB|nr:transcription initiation factor IIB [Nitrososphaeraceae archaeon]MDW0148239.1 transcription initiation factor IIB [Nitrososphaeraceae archaeon]